MTDCNYHRILSFSLLDFSGLLKFTLFTAHMGRKARRGGVMEGREGGNGRKKGRMI